MTLVFLIFVESTETINVNYLRQVVHQGNQPSSVQKWMLFTACIIGAFGVVSGAFGAHYLSSQIEESSLSAYKTGVLYHLLHAVMICVAVLVDRASPEKKAINAAWLFLAGIILFSGSLYLLAVKDLVPFNVSWAGPVTPIGGICFIGGWIYLAISALKTQPRPLKDDV